MTLEIHVLEILEGEDLSPIVITKAREWANDIAARSPSQTEDRLERLSLILGDVHTSEIAQMVAHASKPHPNPTGPKPTLSPSARVQLRQIGEQDVDLSPLAWALLGTDVYVRAWNRMHFGTD